MVKQSSAKLDEVFRALANPRRREMLGMLTRQSRSVSELARPLNLSLPAIHKHIITLEQAGLIRRRKVGRTSMVVLRVRALAEAEAWIERNRSYWNRQLDALETYVEDRNERKSRGTNR